MAGTQLMTVLLQAQDIGEGAVHCEHLFRSKPAGEFTETCLRIDSTGLLDHDPGRSTVDLDDETLDPDGVPDSLCLEEEREPVDAGLSGPVGFCVGSP